MGAWNVIGDVEANRPAGHRNQKMNRKPPNAVKKALRDEVGFGCPVPDCGSPYLEWHHFDPPWHVEEHHRPEGMIALCREHHIQADNGAFTVDQMRQFKENGKQNWAQVKGRFNWMRNRLLLKLGGNFFYETPCILTIKGKRVIWFERDSDNYLLLNLVMLTTTGQPRAQIVNNEWLSAVNEADILCPPAAKSLRISYTNGDMVSIEFIELNSIAEAAQRYRDANFQNWGIVKYPITAVEVTHNVAGVMEFSGNATKFGTMVGLNLFTAYCVNAIVIE